MQDKRRRMERPVQLTPLRGEFMGLDKYQKMRDFEATPEPRGRAPRTRRRKLTYVIQKHRASHLHYDFRLEIEGVLKSWAVPKGPSYDPSVRRLAMMTEDHPFEYGSFEGVIPAGNYGAGNVIIWDNGTWEPVETDDPAKAVREGKLAFRLDGKKLHGEWALVRMNRGKGNEWLLLKHRDEWATKEVDVTKVAPLSVISGLGVEDVNPANEWESNRKAGRGHTVADVARSEKKKAPASRRKKTAAPAGKKAAATRRTSAKPAKKGAARGPAKKKR